MNTPAMALNTRQQLLVYGGSVFAFASATLVMVLAFMLYANFKTMDLMSTAYAYSARLSRQIETANATTEMLSKLVESSVEARIQVDAAKIVKRLMSGHPFISDLAVAPGGILDLSSHVGKEDGDRLDLMTDPSHKFAAQRAASTGRIAMIGPFHPFLEEDHPVIILLSPVFVDVPDASPLWGFALATISQQKLLLSSDFDELALKGIGYEVWKTDDNGTGRIVIAKSGAEPLANAIDVPVSIPDDNWTLSISNRATVTDGIATMIAVLVGLLAAACTFHFLRRTVQNTNEFHEKIDNANERIRRLSAMIETTHSIDDHLMCGYLLWSPEQTLVAWNRRMEEMYPSLAPILEQGISRKVVRVHREKYGEREVLHDWESVGSWFRRLPDGRTIMIYRVAMPDGGRLVMHTDMSRLEAERE